MQQNDWNSRDGKSGKSGKSAKRTPDSSTKSSRPNTERTSDSNNAKGKVFDQPGYKDAAKRKGASDDDRPFRKRAAGSSSFSKPPGDKPYTKRDGDSGSFNKSSGERPYKRRDGENTSFNKPAGERPYKKREGDSSSFSKPAGDRPYKKREGDSSSFSKPSGGRTYKKREADSSSFSKPAGERVYKKRDGDITYNRTSNSDRPYRKREADARGKSEGDGKRFSKPSATSHRPPTEKRGSTEDRTDHKPVTRGRKNAVVKDDGMIRLNRYISNAGICSRRKADELIAAGVVSVNGEAVTELGSKINPGKDVIRYNGEVLKRERMVYVLLNKPKDYITTTDDPHERHTVMHLVEKASNERIYPVGRLDRNTTGLLLLTNDGDLTDKLSHPKNNITKIYQVELNKSLTQGDLNKIAYGLELEDGVIKPDEVTYVAGGTKREIGIQIHSGKNRIVRRIFEHLGYDVVKLDRVIYANLTKKDLPRGRWRYLEEKEVIQLKHLI